MSDYLLRSHIALHLGLKSLRAALDLHVPEGPTCDRPLAPCEVCEIIPRVDSLLSTFVAPPPEILRAMPPMRGDV